MPTMFNTELGKFADVSDDRVNAHKRVGYVLVEMLVDTARGAEMPINIEDQAGGRERIGTLLAKVRRDVGHEGEPAFMRRRDWAGMADAARAKSLKAPEAVEPGLTTNGQYAATIAMQTAQLFAQGERMREMEAKFAALSKGKP